MARSSRARIAAAAMLSLVATACGPSHEVAGSHSTDTYVEELRIGLADGADEYLIGQISRIAVGADGTIYAADRQVGLVRIYAANGEFLGNVGGGGEGPGEYGTVQGLLALDDGRLALLDPSQSRVTLFTPEGSFLTSFSTSRTYGGGRGLETTPSGQLLVRTTIWSGRGLNPPADAPSGYEVFSPDGIHIETIVSPPLQRPYTSDPFVLNVGYWMEGFTVVDQHAWSPLGHYLTAVNDVYDIHAVVPGGEPVILARRDIPRPRTHAPEREQWESIVGYMRERWALMGYPTDAPNLTDQKPYFRALHAGASGGFWTWRYTEVSETSPHPGFPDDGRPQLTWRETEHVYDGFAPDGTLLGSVTLPLLFVPLYWRGHHVWGSFEDEAGTRYVLRLRLHPSLD